jgi:uncharacterized protein (DUF4415 family)
MNVKEPNTPPGLIEAQAPFLDPADDAPDLSTPEWVARFDSVKVRRGRPVTGEAKQQVTLRLDPEIILAFKAGGKGWQRRMNDALRAAAGLPERT